MKLYQIFCFLCYHYIKKVLYLKNEKKIECLNDCKNLNILFVDDSEFVRKIIKKTLSKYFNKVITASSVKEALEILKNNHINVVISDIVMPAEMDGFEFAKIVKENYPDIIFIFLSSFFDTDTLLKAIELHIDGFLIKPLNENLLLHTLQNALYYKKALLEEKNLLNQYKEIVDQTLLVSKTDLKGNITYVNDAFVKVSGFKKEELLGKPHSIVKHPDMKKEVFKDLWSTILNKKTWKGLIKNRKKNGEAYYVESVIKPILDKEGNIKEFIALRKDVTNYIDAQKLINDKLKVLNDALLVLIKIEDYEDLEVIYDEDTLFKLTNRIIKRAKNLIKTKFSIIEEYVNVAPGIFGFLIEKYEKEGLEEFFNSVVRDIINKPLVVNEIEHYPLIKLSYACGNKDLYTNAMLGFKELQNSEQRVICANGLYKKEKEVIIKNIEMLKTITYALQNNKVICLFQPIVNNNTKKIIKYESLVRIINKDNNLLTPWHFLEIAKKAGIYTNITLKVLENSFKVYKEYNIPISINLSPSDILIDSVRDKIYSLLKEHNPKKSMITFEILEDEIIQIPNTMKEFIDNLIKLNANIAIDDFGNGYSNFTRIIEANADIIKIDGVLIKGIDKDQVKQDIVETIVNFAKKENKKTVAEFVENKEIFKVVKKLGVDCSQGYYFYKPLKEEEIKSLL